MVRALSRVIKSNKALSLLLVAGGGPTARKYISAGSRFGIDLASLDEMGMAVSRLNALSLVVAFDDLAVQRVPLNLGEVVAMHDFLAAGKLPRIIICGGMQPGQSTNAVAALIAEKTRAKRFVNATDVDGVFDKDPRQFKDAKLLVSVSPKQLSGILEGESVRPGAYDLMDPVALRLLARSRIPTSIVKCESAVLQDILLEKSTRGTEIVYTPSD